MAEKPTPQPDDETYSDEEAAKRRDATVRATIGMKKLHEPRKKDRRSRTADPRNASEGDS